MAHEEAYRVTSIHPDWHGGTYERTRRFFSKRSALRSAELMLAGMPRVDLGEDYIEAIPPAISVKVEIAGLNWEEVEDE